MSGTVGSVAFCKHGGLARKCEICERDAEIERLRAELAQARSNEARYLFLRKQHWNDAEICCVMKPKKALMLGAYCPSEELLDEEIDAAMRNTAK